MEIDIWKASLLQESDFDAAYVDASVQSIQVMRTGAGLDAPISIYAPCRQIHVPQVRRPHSFDRK